MQTDAFIGKQIDSYTVQERIGIGGMATVYRAHQPSVNRSVALKLIRLDPNAGETPEFARRFEQEAKVIASLEHIHILPIYDYGVINNELAYLAMRLLRGGSLSSMMAEGPLNIERACDIFTQIARGLHYAHTRGVIHRDLKPSNILLDEAGNAYLTDFGLAKMLEDSQHLTKTGTIVGTPSYMSPEQLRGDVTVGPRSDIYSMGVILYHMLVGRPPFDSTETNMISVIYQHLEKNPTPPRELNSDISPEVEAVILKALAKNPDERFDTVDEMAHALNFALGRRISTGSFPAVKPHDNPAPSNKSSATTQAASSVKQTNQHALIAGAATIALMIVLLVVGAILRQQEQTTIALATVVAGDRGVSSEMVPTNDEIQRAAARLGDSFIAYVACNQTSEYHATQAREMRDFASRYGLDFRIYDANNDPYSQVTQIERARADGASALIVCPLDISLLDQSLRSVQQANMPLVMMQSNIESYGGVLIGGDDYLMGLEAGRAAGRIIRDELGGRANVIILDYPSMPVIVNRANGLEDGVLEIAPSARVIGRYLGATRDNGRASVAELLEDGIAFNVILSINDAGAYGAVEAMEAAEIDPASVIISSVDAEALARQHILRDYFFRASVDVGREQFSRTAVDSTVKLLAGATVPELILVPPGQAVTREILERAAESAD